ncbi:MAG: hypothetical protein IPN79_14015 [Saprospiraceae bacterium]|nr:hypothetical protein [Saprospiraceae bacterium]
MEAAKEFIASLDKKSASKVFYNIDIAEQTNDMKIFKKLQGESGKPNVVVRQKSIQE